MRFTELALAALGATREEIDALNVYPVPDGDTGTNMYLTFESARNAMVQALHLPGGADVGSDGPEPGPEPAAGPDELRAGLAAFSRGALLGARGNSGVILSQLVGAMCKRVAAADPDERAAQVFADGMALATRASYAAVGEPVEGTILSVARAASDAASQAATIPANRVGHVIRAAARAARAALERTPEQLPVLRDAGVVDAGGRGLCVVLDAAETAVTGRRPVSAQQPLGARAIPVPLPSGDLTPGGPAYEVMFLLDAPDDRIPGLRRALAPVGDSLVVVGGDGLWNVHVHVNDVGAAIEAGGECGRPPRITVTRCADQIAGDGPETVAAQGRAVVAVVQGDGLVELYEAAGAVVVVGGVGRRPSTGQILDAVTSAGTAEVIVLPNDRDSIAS